MRSVSIEQALWLASFVGHGLLAFILIKRKIYRQLPVFAFFISGELLRNITLYFVYRHGSKHTYFIAYWAMAGFVDLFLQAGVVYELAKGLLRPNGVWIPETRGRFPAYASAGVLFATILTWLPSGGAATATENLVIRGSFFTAVLMAEIASGMLILSVHVGLPWRGPAARVSLAFGFYSLFIVLLEIAHDLFGRAYGSGTDFELFNLQAASYVLCQIYWAVSLWRCSPSRIGPRTDARERAEFWAKIVHRKVDVE